jgi:hypothetical protein
LTKVKEVEKDILDKLNKMTYRGKTKGLGPGTLPEGIHKVYARNQNYSEYQRQEEEKKRRDALYKQNAPRNPISRAFYNLERMKLGR